MSLSAEEISVDLLPELITQLSAPLGLKDKAITSALLMDVIKDLRIPIRKNKCVGYKDTFLAWYDKTSQFFRISGRNATLIVDDDAQ